MTTFHSNYFKNYSNGLKYLYSINNRLKNEGVLAPNLNSILNTNNLYNLIGKPLDKIPTIHIGGTNGKGSTCYKVSKCLELNGFKTGLFVSPHISSFCERIQVNGELLSQEDFMINLDKVLTLCEQHTIPATLFEITFIMSCLQFERKQCDVVVLEVGCGGEWDATNVIQPSTSIVCSVGFDHMRILGNTLELIATNKAGIFKTNVPALIGPGCPYEPMKIIADSRNAPLYKLEDALRDLSQQNILPSPGSHPLIPHDFSLLLNDTDQLNSQLSLVGLSLTRQYLLSSSNQNITSPSILEKFRELNLHDERLLNVLMNSRPPCRWEEIDYIREIKISEEQKKSYKIRIVLDIAHNAPAIEALMDKVKLKLPNENLRVLYGMSRDKDIESCLSIIGKVIPMNKIHFIQSNNWRAVTVETLQNILQKIHSHENSSSQYDLSYLSSSTPFETAIDMLIQDKINQFDTTNSDSDFEANEKYVGTLLVCGSGYIMSKARKMIGIIESDDYTDLANADKDDSNNIINNDNNSKGNIETKTNN